MNLFRNKKHNTLYFVLGPVTDATNDRRGSKMIEYQSLETGETFVRDEAEFGDKFEPYENSFSEDIARQGKRVNALIPILIGMSARLDSAMDVARLALYYPDALPREEVVRTSEDSFIGNEEFLTELAVAGMYQPYTLKIQRPLSSNDPGVMENNVCLVYNEDRSVMQHLTMDEQAMQWFEDDLKIYVKARLWIDGTLQLIGRIEDQDW